MQAASSKRTIGCIGKCTSGLRREELDQITDNISKTLTHPKGRQIFRRYLQQRGLRDNLECLDLYEACCQFIESDNEYVLRHKNLDIERLTSAVERAKEMCEDLDGIPQIDLALLECYNEALNSMSRNTMLAVLENTKDRTRDHLRRVHDNFKRYASEPCPMTK